MNLLSNYSSGSDSEDKEVELAVASKRCKLENSTLVGRVSASHSGKKKTKKRLPAPCFDVKFTKEQ